MATFFFSFFCKALLYIWLEEEIGGFFTPNAGRARGSVTKFKLAAFQELGKIYQICDAIQFAGYLGIQTML